MNKKFLRGLVPIVMISLSCEPMIAIGKYELLILIGLIAVLLGPPLYRFLRKVEEFMKRAKKEK